MGWAVSLPWLFVCFSKVLAQIELGDLVAAQPLLPPWPKPGPNSVVQIVQNSQVTQGNFQYFQLCVAGISCIVRVIAFLVAH